MSDRYEFIDAEYAGTAAGCGPAPAITCLCKWLGVSKSGCYEWRSRPDSATAERRRELALIITKIFDDSDATYGYRRIAAQLARWGVRAGPELVRRLMRGLGLVACQPRPWRPSATRQGEAGPVPDLVNRDFSAAAPGEKMVGDVTYLPTWQGWEYLATVIDCATREVIGWRWATTTKPRLSLLLSRWRRGTSNSPPMRSFTLIGAAITPRQSSERSWTGWGSASPWAGRAFALTNALAESFNASLKVERVHRTVYPTREKARQDVARYIELRYNRARLHSALGYRTTQEVHDEYLNWQRAA